MENSATPSRVLTNATTGSHLANCAATLDQARSPLFVSSLFDQSTILSVDPSGAHHRLELKDTAAIGGLYRLPDDNIAALEFGGDRLLKFGPPAAPGPMVQTQPPLTVCQTPRLLTQHGQKAWILCRDAKRRLVEVDLQAWTARPIELPGSTPADLALDPSGKWLLVANLASHDLTPVDLTTGKSAPRLPVEKEPYRLIASASTDKARMVVLYANSNRATLIDPLERSLVRTHVLEHIPTDAVFSPDGQHLFMLSAGAGRLMVASADTLEVSQSLEAPVGSASVVWNQGRLLLSTGKGGALRIFDWKDQSLTLVDEVQLGAAAGKICAGPGPDNVWLTGPQAGRVARYKVQ